MVKISVIVTTFNRARLLEQAVTSVVCQTFRDFEILILDNNSTDETESIVRRFGDRRLNYIRHAPLNISQARNLGLGKATGEFVAFLDDDDLWLPNKIESQLEVFERGPENLALVYGGLIRIDDAGNELSCHAPVLRGMILRDLLKQKDDFTGAASNPMLRKSTVVLLGGYNEQVTTGEDWELYLRLAEKYPIDFTSEPVVKIRCHPGPRLGDKLKEAAELEIMIVEKYKHLFDEDPKLKSFYFQKIGGKFIRVNQSRLGRRYLREAIKTQPVNISVYIQYLFSFLGDGLYRRAHGVFKSIVRHKWKPHQAAVDR